MTNDNWKVDWKVFVGGKDRSSVMHPYLLSVGVTLMDGGSADKCRLSFNDEIGEIKLPQPGDPIQIAVKGKIVFSGISDEPEFIINKNGGSVLSVSGSSVDMTSAVKKPLSFHMDDASLGDVMRKAAELAGIRNMRIDPAFDQIRRDYWLVNRQGEADAGDVDAVNVTRLLAASEDQAREQASARNRESAQNRGSGRITIDLDPNAQPEGLCVLKGARVGVDGNYRIGQVDHTGSKPSGSITQMSVRHPQGGAGKDTRPTR